MIHLNLTGGLPRLRRKARPMLEFVLLAGPASVLVSVIGAVREERRRTGTDNDLIDGDLR